MRSSRATRLNELLLRVVSAGASVVVVVAMLVSSRLAGGSRELAARLNGFHWRPNGSRRRVPTKVRTNSKVALAHWGRRIGILNFHEWQTTTRYTRTPIVGLNECPNRPANTARPISFIGRTLCVCVCVCVGRPPERCLKMVSRRAWLMSRMLLEAEPNSDSRDGCCSRPLIHLF